MKSSTPLKISRTRTVMEKLTATKARYGRAMRPWVVPTSIANAFKTMSPMIARYHKGDYRHTDNEALAEEEFALWLVNQHRDLGGSPTIKEATWTSPWLPRKQGRLIHAT